MEYYSTSSNSFKEAEGKKNSQLSVSIYSLVEHQLFGRSTPSLIKDKGLI